MALEDVCEVNPPRLRDDTTEADLVTFVPMAAVEEENGGIDVAAARPLKEVRKGYTQFRSGDVLLAKITPCMENGKLAVVPAMPSTFGYGSTEFFVLRPRRPEFALWIARCLSRRSFRDIARHHMQGAAGQLRVPKKWLQTVEIPVPPLPEQHRIVTKLDELFSEIDAGVAALERAQAKLERYRASVLKAAVEGRLTERWREQNPPTETGAELLARILVERQRRWEEEQLAAFEAKGKKPPKDWKKKYKEPVAPDTEGLPELPEGWCWATVDQLARVVRGASPRPAGDPRYFGGSHTPWITVGELTGNDSLYLRRVSCFLTEEGRYRSRVIPADTLLLTNSGATLGVPRITLIEGCINDGSVGLLDVAYPLKLYLCLFLSTLTQSLRANQQGAAQPNLNTSIVKAIQVPVPPTPEQHAIGRLVEGAFARQSGIANSTTFALTRATHLRQSILSHAFQGRLVPQDPSDEPASTLLERIRAEREARPGAPTAGARGKRRPAARPPSRT